MNEKNVQQILYEIAEEEIPSQSINLVGKIKTSYQQKTSAQKKTRLNWAVGFATLLLAGFIFLALTPQGHVIAEGVLDFFIQEDSDTVNIDPTRTAWAVMLEKEGTPTPHPFFEPYTLTVAEVEAQAGYDVLEPEWVPSEMVFEGAAFYAEKNVVQQRWRWWFDEGGQSAIRITMMLEQKSVSAQEECRLCSSVGASATVHKVNINGAKGEYVTGFWSLEEAGAVWHNNPLPQRLRWQADGMLFELSIDEGMYFAVSMKEMVQVAESLYGILPTADEEPVENYYDRKNADKTVEEVENLLQFDVYGPTWLPEGKYQFQGANLDAENEIAYQFWEVIGYHGNGIVLSQEQIVDGVCQLCSPVEWYTDVEEIHINGVEGKFITNKPQGLGYPPQRLRWQVNGMAFEIYYVGQPEKVPLEEMVQIAESLGVTDIVADRRLDFFIREDSDTMDIETTQEVFGFDEIEDVEEDVPEPDSIFYADKTVAEVESALQFDVYEPTWVPEGKFQFAGANFDAEEDIAYQFWGLIGGGTNGMSLTQEPAIFQEECSICSPVGASAIIEEVSINGIKGEFVIGVWYLEEEGAVWHNDPYLQRLRWQVDGMAFELSTMVPLETITKEEMVQLAESLR